MQEIRIICANCGEVHWKRIVKDDTWECFRCGQVIKIVITKIKDGDKKKRS